MNNGLRDKNPGKMSFFSTEQSDKNVKPKLADKNIKNYRNERSSIENVNSAIGEEKELEKVSKAISEDDTLEDVSIEQLVHKSNNRIVIDRTEADRAANKEKVTENNNLEVDENSEQKVIDMSEKQAEMRKKNSEKYDALKKEYSKSFSLYLTKCEAVYGLNVLINDKKLLTLGIDDFIEVLKRKLKSYEFSDMKTINSEASKMAMGMCYLNCRVSFHSIKFMSFKNYKGVDRIGKVLLLFLNQEESFLKNPNKLNIILQALRSAEIKNPKIINSLSYRYLRLFVVFNLHYNCRDASIIARILLTQLAFTSEELRKNNIL